MGDTLDLERDEPTLGAPENHPMPRSWPCAKPTRDMEGAQSGWYAGTMAWAEDEPTRRSLGGGDQTRWSHVQGIDETEVENEHAGDVLDEPHDPGQGEPWLGWGNTMGQPGTGGAEDMVDVDDSPDYGGGFTGEGKDMARQCFAPAAHVNLNRL
jgi:hypothetical protein